MKSAAFRILQVVSILCLMSMLTEVKAEEAGLGSSLLESDGVYRGNSKWSASYFSFSSVGVKQVQDSSASVFMYNYVGANYKISKEERFNIRPVFYTNTAGYDKYGAYQNVAVKAGDFVLNYSNYAIALLPGDWSLLGEYSMMLPTSEASQTKKMIVGFKSHTILEKELRDGWAMEYNLKPYYYMQSQTTYRNEYDKIFPDGGTQHRIEVAANPIGKLDHYFTVGKYLNKYFTPAIDVGFVHEWYHTSSYVRGGSASRNQMKIAPNTEIHVNSRLWFILGVESDVDLNNSTLEASGDTVRWRDDRGQSNEFFRPENSQYYLLTFWSI